jgi:hypothetical protein
MNEWVQIVLYSHLNASSSPAVWQLQVERFVIVWTIKEKFILVVRPLRVYIYRNNQIMIVIVAVRPNNGDNFIIC